MIPEYVDTENVRALNTHELNAFIIFLEKERDRHYKDISQIDKMLLYIDRIKGGV